MEGLTQGGLLPISQHTKNCTWCRGMALAFHGHEIGVDVYLHL